MDQNRILGGALGISLALCAVAFGSAVFFHQEVTMLRGQVAEYENEQPQKAVQIPQPSARPTVSSASVDSEEMKALNAYIDKLEKDNHTLRGEVNRLTQENAQNMRQGPRQQRQPRQSLAEIKENNPELYERIRQRQEQMRQRTNNRCEFFDKLDTSRMTAEQQGTISAYRNLLGEIANLQAEENVDMRSMWQLNRELNQMRNNVRGILIENLSSQLGADAQALATGLAEIDTMIGANQFNRGPGGPGGFGAPGGPPPMR